MSDDRAGFTGWSRSRRTRPGVRVGEVVSRSVITVGGIGTIVSVAGILVFLVAVVLPLFGGADVEAAGSVDAAAEGREPVRLLVDDYRLLAAVLHADGTLTVRRLDDGTLVEERPLVEGAELTAWSFAIEDDHVALGFADGTTRVGRIGFRTSFLADDSEEARALADLEPGGVAPVPGGVVRRTAEGLLRRQALVVELEDPVPVAEGEAVARLDQAVVASETGGDTTLAVLTETGRLELADLRARQNLLTGEVSYRAKRAEVAYEAPGGRGAPDHLLLAGLGDTVYLAWRDGLVLRIDARDRAAARVAEAVDLVPEEGLELTALGFVLGRTTLVAGDSGGGLRAWFPIRRADAATADGVALVPAHELARAESPVVALSPSSRTRVLAAGHADGTVRLHQVTSEELLAAVAVPGGGPVRALALFPKEDGLAALAGGRLHRFELDPGHPEASLRALFAPIWYEGYPEPEHVWQSSSGTDDFEPKLGLTPLVFGTLKATFYSMLFGAPLAILAAIYTSEFLDRRLRAPVKSTIEVMASLPSVVLGFLAALVIAPYVQRFLPATLAIFLTFPLALLLGAYLWQLLPRRVALRGAGWQRLVAIGTALVLSVALAFGAGPLVERALFAGDLELWLDGQVGSAVGGWLFLTLPLAGLVVALVYGGVVNPRLRRVSGQWGHARSALFDLGKFAVGCAAAAGLALALGAALAAAGLDPREGELGFLGTYVQRNALVVGFVMGFAVIPIIYTLAEDALSSVPDHLRLASLGAGATPWQTAIRVVVPTATSGLFSALMIGLGRAVGETMIVLMATGNTPVIDLNVFNGFRTLSANIAVELPEAARGSTHYRTLFLAALVLFGMTFCLNTAAELVRLRFRRRFQRL